MCDGVYYDYAAIKACGGDVKCEKGSGNKARREQNSPPPVRKNRGSQTFSSWEQNKSFCFERILYFEVREVRQELQVGDRKLFELRGKGTVTSCLFGLAHSERWPSD